LRQKIDRRGGAVKISIETFKGDKWINIDLSDVKEIILKVALIMAGNTEVIKQEQEALNAKRRQSKNRRHDSLRPVRKNIS
jgi:uncharacterized protein YegL